MSLFISKDIFFHKSVILLQPSNGYRINMDTVLLSASVPCNAKGSLLDMGCGVGAASLLSARRAPQLSVWGVDCFADLIFLATQNATLNGINANYYVWDIIKDKNDIFFPKMSYVLMNPPYHTCDTEHLPMNLQRRTAFFTDKDSLKCWIEVAARSLKRKGTLFMIQKVDRLSEIMHHLSMRFGGITVLPLQSRKHGAIKRFMIKARCETKEPSRILPPLILHENHNMTLEALRILNGEISISWK